MRKGRTRNIRQQPKRRSQRIASRVSKPKQNTRAIRLSDPRWYREVCKYVDFVKIEGDSSDGNNPLDKINVIQEILKIENDFANAPRRCRTRLEIKTAEQQAKTTQSWPYRELANKFQNIDVHNTASEGIWEIHTKHLIYSHIPELSTGKTHHVLPRQMRFPMPLPEVGEYLRTGQLSFQPDGIGGYRKEAFEPLRDRDFEMEVRNFLCRSAPKHDVWFPTIQIEVKLKGRPQLEIENQIIRGLHYLLRIAYTLAVDCRDSIRVPMDQVCSGDIQTYGKILGPVFGIQIYGTGWSIISMIATPQEASSPGVRQPEGLKARNVKRWFRFHYQTISSGDLKNSSDWCKFEKILKSIQNFILVQNLHEVTGRLQNWKESFIKKRP